jgi:hypothetical protein
MEEFRPERRFLETYCGTFVLVVLTIYAPHLWLLLTDAGNDWLQWCYALPGLPSFFLIRFDVSMEHCRLISLCLALLMPITVAALIRLFPSHKKQIAASAIAYSLFASYIAYRISPA